MRLCLVASAVLVGAAIGSTTTVNAVFKCNGGSTVLNPDQINDNYCDCNVDGLDETLTPACSNKGHSTRFICAASGPLDQSIPASRVWDGVCDCCDGSDESQNQGGGMRPPPLCDPGGCEVMIEEARAQAAEAHRRAKLGIEKREVAEAESRRVVEKWEAMLGQAELERQEQADDRKAVEKLEALLKVYLRDEERLETREREELARGKRCSAVGRGWGGRAAAMGACEDTTAEREAAAKVRTVRAAARARKDAEDERKAEKKSKRGRKGKAAGKKKGDSASAGGNLGDTAEDILDLRWPLLSDAHPTSSSSFSSSRGDSARKGGRVEPGKGESSGSTGGDAEMGVSLRTYVKQRQQGSVTKGGSEIAEEKKAEELRKTALFGPVLNDGQKGVYLGVTYLLRVAGFPTLGLLRGLLTVGEFVGHRVAVYAAAAAKKFGLPESVRVALDGYRDNGLPGLSRYLDYRRYPAVRALVVRWDQFLDGRGRFLVVMWDAPVALWDFFFPERDYEHERPEAAMLREGIARARASLGGSAVDRTGSGKGKGGTSRRGPHLEAERMYGLDLGEGKRFAALSEICLDLNEGGYTYSLCPFKDAKQADFSLGKWHGWGLEQGRDRHRSMLFDGGSRCPKKRQRSAEVFVECGPDHSLVSADEFQVCRYKLTLETPLACTEANLGQAQRVLERFSVWTAGNAVEKASDDHYDVAASSGIRHEEL